MVIPFSYVVSGLGGIISGAPIAFALIWASVQFRSTIAGFVSGVGSSIAAVAFGWCIFTWLVGAGSFTFLPFISSVLLLVIVIPRNLRKTQDDTLLKKEFKNKGQSWFAGQMGNVWSLFVGEILGLIMAATWFFWYSV